MRICPRETFCGVCRDRDHGQRFRAGLLPLLVRGKLVASDQPVDFECPHEMPWGYVAPEVPVQAAPAPFPTACTGDGPGSVVKSVLTSVGIESMPGCGCEAMCSQMNRWGWTGCLVRLPELVSWFSEKARERGIKVSLAKLGLALGAALRGGLKAHAGIAEQATDGTSNGDRTAVQG